MSKGKKEEEKEKNRRMRTPRRRITAVPGPLRRIRDG